MTQAIQKKKFAKIAVFSFVIGLLSLVPLLGVMFSLLAVPVGLIAVIFTSIKKDVLRGRGLAVSGLLLGLLGFISCAALMKMTYGPTTNELTALFKSNRVDFEALRDMFLEDKNVGSVGPQEAHLLDKNRPGISSQRQQKYAELLNKLKIMDLWTWKRDKQDNKTAIAFFAHRGGWAVSGTATFYIWFSYKPAKSDAERMKGISVSSFKPIDGEEYWYILHESN